MFFETLEYLMDHPRDPRTKDWLIFRSPALFLGILALYVYSAKYLGPKLMRDKEPFKIRTTLLLYNAFQVLANVYYFTSVFYYAFVVSGYSFVCQGITMDYSPVTQKLLNLFHEYLLIRFTDFLDTFFFVVTKKFDHISVLHVVHHTMVVFNGWIYFQFTPGGQGVFAILVNMCIHAIMYSYYFLAALGPHMQPYLWWKKHLTSMQIAQFVICIVHALIPLVIDCGFPRQFILFGVPQGFLILFLFVRFYLKSYSEKNKFVLRNNLISPECYPQSHFDATTTSKCL